MRIGVLGLGKVGSCMAVALAAAGHDVCGYDPDPGAAERLASLPGEQGAEELLASGASVALVSTPGGVVAASQVVFVAVQTPHAPGYGGEAPAPDERRDFEYAFLVQACRDVCHAAQEQRKDITLVVASTVLPGTMSRLIVPLANRHVTVLYSPVLISLGTTIRDFRNPPVVICGRQNGTVSGALREVYHPMHDAPFRYMDFASAELAKVAMNVCLSMRITFANYLAQVAHEAGADVDVVTDLLGHAYTREIGAGLGDGGPCRPRDLIALSLLSQRLGVACDLPGMLVQAREAQAEWLAALATRYSELHGIPVTVMGRSYKPGTVIDAGSPALLLAGYLGAAEPEPGAYFVNRIVSDPGSVKLSGRQVYVLAVRDHEFAGLPFPYGSVVIDPWGIVPDQAGVTVIRVGRR